MLEHESLQGISSMKPTGFRKRSNSINICEDSETYTISSIIQQLSVFHSTMSQHGMEQGLINQAVKQLFFLIGSITLNNIMLRKDMCSCRKGMQIRSVVIFYWNKKVLLFFCRHKWICSFCVCLGATSVTWRNGWRRGSYKAQML